MTVVTRAQALEYRYNSTAQKHEEYSYRQWQYSSAPAEVLEEYDREREAELALLARDARDAYIAEGNHGAAKLLEELARAHDSNAVSSA